MCGDKGRCRELNNGKEEIPLKASGTEHTLEEYLAEVPPMAGE
jgi:hypothetical protein